MTGKLAAIAAIPAWARYGLAAVVQLGAVATMVAGQAAILRDGAEVTLATMPVDPRDFLRGDYVVLNYAISSVEKAKVERFEPPNPGDVVYVELARGADGLFEAKALSRQAPATVPPDRAVIRGRAAKWGGCWNSATCATVRVQYGLESYFVPEGQGRELEKLRGGQLRVVAAVTPDGRARIKRLLVNGGVAYEEPPF